ncbi:sodium channel protein type 4 subunit alpha B-like [Betta splendens]|uniref:Sodium channel protein type 4 subunit alpha B-like n=1 Tax=Betta splendens TaxID=158456 RepID=A0A9W2XW33_BETSP|nr:sodium channel protein type 4 subunit alpha B-like [Betta splendens]
MGLRSLPCSFMALDTGSKGCTRLKSEHRHQEKQCAAAMSSTSNRFWEFWRSQRERGALQRRVDELRLEPSQLKLLLSNRGIRAELPKARMVSLLPPVDAEVFRRLTPESGVRCPEVTDQPKAAVHLESGKPLPFVYGTPPIHLLNTPLEELDPFYQSQKTFIVLDRGNIIHRFSAESSCYLLSPFSPVRRVAIKILLNSWFRLFILLTILANSLLSWFAQYIFTAIYTCEVIVKVMSRSFCMGRFTFLRDPWNWLDIMVITTGLLSSFVHMGKASVLMPVFLHLKMIAVYPGMRKTAEALVKSVKQLAGVFILTVSGLSILATIGLLLFMGSLSQKCVTTFSSNVTEPSFLDYNGNLSFITHIKRPGNYYYLSDHIDPLLCGNNSMAGACPEGYSCLSTGENPNYGFTSFDSFGWSLLSLFRLMTQDYWENLLQMVLRTSGKSYVILFALIFLPGCFCLISLIVAAVVVGFVERDEAGITEAKQKEEEFLQILEVMRRKDEQRSGGDSAADRKSHEHTAGPEQDRSSCFACWTAFANLCLKWNCCACWRWLKQRLQAFVTNPFFDLGAVICTVLNVIIFSMNHYPMTMTFEYKLILAELVFTVIFQVEVILRVLASDPYGYFKVGWNVFDFILFVISIITNFIVSYIYLSPVVRVFRLGRWWPSFNLWMKVVWSSMKALRNLTLILFIIVFMFSIVGEKLFRDDYNTNLYRISAEVQLPRWHQADFFHAFLVAVRILCGEWIETLWDCMEVSGQATCQIFYLMVMLIGNLLVLNLFLGLLLSSLNGDYFVPVENVENNIQIALNQIRNRLKIRTYKETEAVDRNKDHACVALDVVSSKQNASSKRASITETEPENEKEEKTQCVIEQKQEKEDESTPEPCCCDSCYRCCPFLDVDTSQGFGRGWAHFRTSCLFIADHKCFEVLIIIAILLSSVALVFEDVYLQQNPDMQDVLNKADQAFACLFLLEMLIKWIALGLKKYFSSFWCWLDFLILAVSVMAITGAGLGCSELGAGLSLRTLRTLRPLRALSRFQGPRVVLEVLAVSLRSMWSELLVFLVVWLFFSCSGVEMFGGQFSYCYNGTSKEQFLPDVVHNKSECMTLDDAVWINPYINFDNVAIGYLALLQVATFKGWLDIMYSAVDTNWVEEQPAYEANLYMYMYFINFIFIGCFFTISFFFRVFIDMLGQQRHKFGGKHFFMTEEQQKYSRVLGRLFSKTSVKSGHRPQNQCQAWLFDLVTNPFFEVFMVVMIFLNMVTMMVETDQQSLMKEMILYWIMFIFILIFLFEFLLKIISFRKHYFTCGWNILDFMVLNASILSLFLSHLFVKFFIPPMIFPMFRLARVCRILHLFHFTRRIRTLLLAFVMSLPALFNICFLLLVLMFTYSAFGMINFAYVNKEAMLDDMFNFETFANSIICMFVITTRAGWDGVLIPLLNKEPDCDLTGHCLSPAVGITFCTSYVLLSLLLVVQLYIAVILEAFNADNAENLPDNDLQMFYTTWMVFDPSASQVIQYSQLSDLCDSLQGPLRIPKPNTIKLARMHLPRLPGDKVHCLDILMALTAQAFGEPGERDALKARLEEESRTKSCPSNTVNVAEAPADASCV